MSLPNPKILHIAPQNFAGMPYDFVQMHRENGFESRLLTLYKNTLDFPEDISLSLPLPKGGLAKKWRNAKAFSGGEEKLKYSEPKNIFEKVYFRTRDNRNRKSIEEAIEKFSLLDFDIYHFDGGMDLFRDCSFAKRLKEMNKKIVCCYFGSDLRTRGVFRELDEMSDLNLTVEFDHLKIYREIKYLYFPFNVSEYEFKVNRNKKVKIVHSPTNRKFKGTDKILPVMERLKTERAVEFILLENISRDKVIEIKSECDIAIDQVGGEMGGSGYGRNSIENLAMGIPTVTEFSEDYLEFISDNPFVHSTIDDLYENLRKLIDDEKLREELAVKGRKWAEDYHSYDAVNEQLMDYYKENNII